MWSRIVSATLGVWLMASPAILHFGDAAGTSGQVAGPIAAAVAVISASAVTREVRWVNVPVGIWLLIAPWVAGYAPVEVVNSVLAGVLLAALSLHRGEIRESFGGGWAALFRSQNSNENGPGA